MMVGMPMTQKPASCLNDDTLHHIFYYLETDRSLCVAALVCKAWTKPAQVFLYNTVCYYAWDLPSDPAAPSRSKLFARTMHSAPQLASLIRYLSVHTIGESTRSQIEWLYSLPAHGLTRFRYMWEPQSPYNSYVLHAPAVHTVTHFIAHGPQNPDSLREILSLPLLETLEVSLIDCDEEANRDDWASRTSSAPRLRKLVIRVYFISCPVALSLFTAFAPQLSAFQLHALYEIFHPHHQWSVAFVSFASHLKQLVLSGSIRWTKEGRPFMDDLIRRTGSLELIRCPEGSYTDSFFRHFPISVVTLELYVSQARFAHESALVDLLQVVKDKSRRYALREIRFLTQYRTTLPLSPHVAELFGKGGVSLSCERVGLYTPVQYMSEAAIIESCKHSQVTHRWSANTAFQALARISAHDTSYDFFVMQILMHMVLTLPDVRISRNEVCWHNSDLFIYPQCVGVLPASSIQRAL